MAGMRSLVAVLVAICGLSSLPAAAADESDLSCAELAEKRAAQQYVEEMAAREDRGSGQVRDSALLRDLLRLDAESYRKKVYEDCLRLRRGSPPAQQPAPADD